MRILISGGGTGGHIYPALAICEELLKRDENHEILYIGTDTGIESDLVPRAGINFKTIEIKGMPRKISFELFTFTWSLFKALRQSKKIVKEFKPDIAIGTGGFVSGPIIFQAKRAGTYSLIHEQNSYPGIANRILSRYIDNIAITFDESAKFFNKRPKQKLTGNPIRDVFFKLENKKEYYEKYKLNPEKKIIFIFGGSNGHKELNDSVISIDNKLENSDFQILLLTGKKDFKRVKKEIQNKNIVILPYLYEIDEAFAIADLIISSSGAITLAEIQAAGLPSILIPKPYTTEDHQTKNAYSIKKHGAAEVIEEKDLTGEFLLEVITEIMSNKTQLKKMKIASKNLSMPNSAKDIVDFVLENYQKYIG